MKRTAIDQFGNGDKCFWGRDHDWLLSRAAHVRPRADRGGLQEKYGMEFRRARHQEDADRGLVEAARSGRLRPCSTSAGCFADRQNFLLYDSTSPMARWMRMSSPTPTGAATTAALVVYPQPVRKPRAAPFITLPSYADKKAGHLRQQSLGAAFGLPDDGNLFLHFRDTTTGLEHLERPRRSSPRATPWSCRHISATSSSTGES